MEYLKRIFKSPVFEDEPKTQQAYMLNIILWSLIFVPIPYLIYTLILNPEDALRALIQITFGEVTNILLLIVLHQGFVKAVSVIQVIAFWFFFTATAFTGNGVQGESYLIGYTLVITIAGILLGGTGALIFTFLSLLSGALMVILHFRGSLATGFTSSPLSTWMVSLVLFPIGALLQRLASDRVRSTLIHARASEERYRLISQISSDYTFSTELDQEGNMYLNWVAGAFKEMTGYTYEEYVASGGWMAHLHPDDIEQDARDSATLKANKPVITEVRTYNKDRELRWVRVYANPVWSEKEDRLIGIVGAVQDITERKQVEEEREALIHELENKNAELERFTYTVSHDLKSPLVTITGFLGFLEKDAMSGNIEGVKSSVNRIAGAAKKMQSLLSDLLELSRIGRLMNPPEDIPFSDIVHEAVDQVRGRLDDIDAIVEIQRDFPIIHGDQIRLVEVVQNLLENSIKYSTPSVRLRIEIGMDEPNEKKFPVFYVRDNGIGIEPQFHERIFGLFNKLDTQSEGTGIGLSLVKRIIEVHNGRIWVESEKGKGATFYFSLPTPQMKE